MCFPKAQRHLINLVRFKIEYSLVKPQRREVNEYGKWKCAHGKFTAQTNLVCLCRDGATDFFLPNALRLTQAEASDNDRMSERAERRECEFELRLLCAMFHSDAASVEC